jgi:hypothetical protein
LFSHSAFPREKKEKGDKDGENNSPDLFLLKILEVTNERLVHPAIHPDKKQFSGSGGNDKLISSLSSPLPTSMLDLSKVCDEKEV